MIKVLYFARLREQLGTAGEEIPFTAGLTTVGNLAALLRQRGGAWSDVLGEEGETIMAAVNRAMARPETPINDGDEVAFFPPVTGG
jgi:molybdopterin synthase sulfur carrier subunit